MNEEQRLSGARFFYVYYLLDATTRELLYIGRSHAPHERLIRFRVRTGLEVIQGIPQRFNSFEESQQAEREAIARHRPPFNAKVMSAAGMFGKSHSPEVRERISQSNRGVRRSAETRARVSASAQGRTSAFKGRHHTEEARIVLSQLQLGRKASPEARAKMSASRKGKPSPLKGRVLGPQKNPRKKEHGN